MERTELVRNGPHGEPSPPRIETVRQRTAKQAEQKQAQRREKQSGATGWVADRAADYSLDGPDFTFMNRTKYLWNPLMDYWFRMEIEGWEKIPEAPVLVIGIHSGAPFVWD